MKLGKSDHTETKRIELLRNIRTMFMLSNATPKIEKLQGIFNSFEQEIQKKQLGHNKRKHNISKHIN